MWTLSAAGGEADHGDDDGEKTLIVASVVLVLDD